MLHNIVRTSFHVLMQFQKELVEILRRMNALSLDMLTINDDFVGLRNERCKDRDRSNG